MFILSDGEGKTGTVELMEPVGLSSHSVHIGIVSSCFVVDVSDLGNGILNVGL